MKENIIELNNISKHFGDKCILDNVSLSVKKGEFLTLLGPSGCGKTTLLRILAGFGAADSGDVIINGENITDIPPHLRPVNTGFQRYALFPHLDVYENIAFGLKLQKVPVDEIDKRVRRVLKMVSMTDYEDRDVESLSGGQQQRVAIARAIVNQPKVLLLDEPLAALDLKMRKDMQIELKEMHRKLGITFIYVTHDQEEALTLSDTIVVMNEGKIQQIGTPTDIYNEPQNSFVADFIGESNILNGRMIKDKLVEFAGHEFECVDEGFEPNEPVNVVIRPEDISLRDYPEQGQWRGTVRSCIFQGVHYEILLDSPDGYEIQVQDYNAYEVGREYGLTVQPEGIHVMKAENLENRVNATVIDTDHIEMLGARFLCQKHGFLKDESVTASFGFNIELTDNKEDGMTSGVIRFILYKGNHYHLTVETPDHQKIYVDTTDIWETSDTVGIKIQPEEIRVGE